MLFRPINVAIVDDHALFRKTLRNYLIEQRNIQVSIVAPDVQSLIVQLEASTPADLVLLDIFLPGINGNEAVTKILDIRPNIKILVLSMSTNIAMISEMLDSGIHGYISKADEPEELMRAITVISENRMYRNGLFTEALYFNKQNRTKSSQPVVELNEREKKIIQLMWEEKSNKEIANELFLGVRSVEKIRQDMKEKVGVKSVIGLLKYAISQRIIYTVGRKPEFQNIFTSP